MSYPMPHAKTDVLNDVITLAARTRDPQLSAADQAEGIVVVLAGALARASQTSRFSAREVAEMAYVFALASREGDPEDQTEAKP